MIPSKIPVTVVILTKNEENSLPKCLDSLGEFERVVVLDSHSDDGTKEICAHRNIEVIDFTWNGSFPKKKQWALENIDYHTSWVMLLDADEVVTEKLKFEIERFVKEGVDDFSAAEAHLCYVFCGRELKFGHRVKKTFLLKLGEANFPVIYESGSNTRPHEVEGHYQPRLVNKLYRLRGELRHDDRDSILKWFERHIVYAEWDSTVRVNLESYEIIDSYRTIGAKLFHRLPFRGSMFFIYSFVIRLGFLDGKAGFRYAASYLWYYWVCHLRKEETSST